MRRALLDWYDAQRRTLPWRLDRDPYRIWISEVMLQQTRVETVVPYYDRWLARFPSVRALADASEDDVLAAWMGLGYYRRARALHEAARVVCDRHGGRVPRDLASLRALPGVGRYTAGAIASIGFGVQTPAVDGNARRVLARLYDLADPGPAELLRRAAALVAGPRPGDLNQALMELGATLCGPRAATCQRCPVSRWCRARARGTELERPARRARRRVPSYRVGTAVVVADGVVLLGRRPRHGMLGGMWEFPGAVAAPGERAADAARRIARALLGPEAHLPARGRALARVEHAYSHRRHAYHAYLFSASGPAAPSRGSEDATTRAVRSPAVTGAVAWTEFAWRAPQDLADAPMGSAQRTIASALAKEGLRGR